jgi:predicted alpha/beta hydrolase family esterase
MVRENLKVIIVPGNGGAKPTDNWFPYVKEELAKDNVTFVCQEFPDSFLAREKYWIPFLKDELKADQDSILSGHSSGAIAAMRFAEENKLLGTILVGAYHSDLGMENERISGYFDRPWNWEKIRENQKWIALFADTKDPWIPIEEPRYLREKLHPDYYESQGHGHFGGDHYKPTFPELVAVLKKKIAESGF